MSLAREPQRLLEKVERSSRVALAVLLHAAGDEPLCLLVLFVGSSDRLLEEVEVLSSGMRRTGQDGDRGDGRRDRHEEESPDAQQTETEPETHRGASRRQGRGGRTLKG